MANIGRARDEYVTTGTAKQRAIDKANKTKRDRWNRLVSGSDAIEAMRSIYAMEKDRYHAYRHYHGPDWRTCGDDCPMRHDRAIAAAVEQALALWLDNAQHLFCRRYDVSIGYYLRLRSRIIYMDAAEYHRAEAQRLG